MWTHCRKGVGAIDMPAKSLKHVTSQLTKSPEFNTDIGLLCLKTKRQ